VDTLDKGMTRVPAQNSAQFNTDELFISGNFYLIFWGQGEAAENSHG
jgi:hypothetical protein